MATFHPLTLTASDTNWRLFSLRKADPKFSQFEQKIFKRDDHTCKYCGFQARTHMEVLNVDGNYRNNKASNLVTACPFCMQCHFLDAVGQGDYGGGTLIYLPDMTQNELNALCHVVFATIATSGAREQEMAALYRSLKLSHQVVEKELGEGMSNPSLLGRLMIDAKAEDLAKIQGILNQHVRLLPNLVRYDVAIRAWALEALDELCHY